MSIHDYGVSFSGHLSSAEHVRSLLAIAAACASKPLLFDDKELKRYLQMTPAQAFSHGQVLVDADDDRLHIKAVHYDRLPEPVFELSFEFECSRTYGAVVQAFRDDIGRIHSLMVGSGLLTITDYDVSPGSDEDRVVFHLGPNPLDRARAMTRRLFSDIQTCLGHLPVDLAGVKRSLDELDAPLALALAAIDAQDLVRAPECARVSASEA